MCQLPGLQESGTSSPSVSSEPCSKLGARRCAVPSCRRSSWAAAGGGAGAASRQRAGPAARAAAAASQGFCRLSQNLAPGNLAAVLTEEREDREMQTHQDPLALRALAAFGCLYGNSVWLENTPIQRLLQAMHRIFMLLLRNLSDNNWKDNKSKDRIGVWFPLGFHFILFQNWLCKEKQVLGIFFFAVFSPLQAGLSSWCQSPHYTGFQVGTSLDPSAPAALPVPCVQSRGFFAAVLFTENVCTECSRMRTQTCSCEWGREQRMPLSSARSPSLLL